MCADTVYKVYICDIVFSVPGWTWTWDTRDYKDPAVSEGSGKGDTPGWGESSSD